MTYFKNKDQEALLLLKSFQTHYDPKRPISEQIKERYIFSPWNTLYERKTWLGRIALWMRYPSEQSLAEQKVLDLFKEAMVLLHQNQENYKELSLEFSKNLIREFESILGTSPSLDSDLFASEEFSYFDELKVYDDIKSRAKIKQFSLLTSLGRRMKADEQISPAQLRSILSNQTEISDETLDLLEHYLTKHPEHASPQWQKHVDSIRQGNREKELIRQRVQSASKGTAEERMKVVDELSQHVLEQVQTLSSGESYQFNCSYGTTKLTLDILFSLLRSLPESMQGALPEPLSTMLASETPPNPEEWVEKAVHNFLQQMTANVPELGKMMESVASDKLFSNDERQLPSWTHDLLPQIFSSYLERFLKDGLLKDVGALSGDELMEKLMTWLAEDGRALLKTQGQEALLIALENKIQTMGKMPVASMIESFNAQITAVGKALQRFVPSTLFSLLGLDAFGESGPLWYKIIKHKNGSNFILEIHTLGNAIQHHASLNEKDVSWPLRFEEISFEELESGFLQRVLYHAAESIRNPKSSFKIQDLYEGPLQLFAERKVHTETRDFAPLAVRPANDFELTLSILFNEKALQQHAIFEMRLELFLDFYLSLCEEGELSISTLDSATLKTLLEGIEDLEETAKAIFLKPEDKGRLKQIIATRKDIQMKVLAGTGNSPSAATPAASFPLPPVLREEVHRILAEHHITKEQIGSIKGILVWCFGEPIGDFIDAIMGTLGNIMPEKPLEATLQKASTSKGVASGSFLGIYRSLLMQGARYALIGAGLYQVGWSPLLILPVGRLLIPYLLPQSISEWYYRFEQALLRSLVKMVLPLVLNCFISQENRKRLETMADEWNQSFLQWKAMVEKNEKVSYQAKFTPKPVTFVPLNNELPPAEPDNPTTSERAPSPPVVKTSPFIYSLTRSKPVETVEVQKILEQTVRDIKDDHARIVKLGYLYHQISLLEIPNGQNDFWQKIEDPQSYLPILMEIGTQLNDFFTDHPDQKFLRKETQDQYVTASFHLLAIMDCLVRRDPSLRLPAPTNAYPLLIWLSHKGTKVKDPDTMERIRQISAYFFPHIDLDHLPEKKALIQASKKTLFNPKGVEEYARIEFLSLGAPELSFLEGLLKNPDNEEKLMALGWKKKSPRNLAIQNLIQECYVFTRNEEGPLIPLSYRFLRLQALFSAQSTNYLFPTHAPASALFSAPAPVYDFGKSNWFSYLGLTQAAPFIPDSTQKAFRDLPADSASYSKKLSSLMKASQTMSQSQIMETVSLEKVFLEGEVSQQEVKKLYLIMTEPKDQILRAFEWFSKNKACLTPQGTGTLLEIIIFHPSRLDDQLRHSPAAAKAIVEFLEEMLRYHKYNAEITIKLVSLGLKLKKFIVKYTPEHTSSLPNFYEHLENLRCECALPPFLRSTVFMLQTLCFDRPIKTGSLEAITAFCCALLTDPLKHFDSKSKTGFTDLVLDFYMYLNLNVEDLDDLFNSKGFRREVLDAVVLKMKNIFPDQFPPESKWKREGVLRFTLGTEKQVEVDLLAGMLKISKSLMKVKANESSFDRLARSHGLYTKFVPEGDTFFSEDGNYRAEDNARGGLDFVRYIQGTAYKLEILPTVDLKASPLYELTGFRASANLQVWKEITTSSLPKFVVNVKGAPEKYCFFQLDETLSNTLIFLSGPNHSQPLVPLSLAEGTHGLAPLGRFCPMSKIKCLADPYTGRIHEFFLSPFNLAFKVRDNGKGKPSAYCLHHNFASCEIAEVQNHPALKGINSYLILENNGQNIILVPTNLFIASPMWKAASFLGPLGERASESLNENFIQNHAKFYSYYIDDKGGLTSKEPAALAYLITLAVMQGEMNTALDHVKALETILHSQPVDRNLILNELAPLALIPPKMGRICYLRLRLLSALERNSLIQLTPTSHLFERTQFLNTRNLFSLTAFIDYQMHLSKRNPYDRLSDAQEYFVYKYILNSLDLIVQNAEIIENLPDFFKANLRKGGAKFLMNLMMPAAMQERWLAICNRFQLSQPIQRQKKVSKQNLDGASVSVLQSFSFLRGVVSEGKNVIHMINQYEAIFENIRNCIHQELVRPPLESQNFDANLKIYFTSYYALARNELPMAAKGDREKLQRLLKNFKGGDSQNSALLIEILLSVMITPRLFLKTEKVVKLFKDSDQLLKVRKAKNDLEIALSQMRNLDASENSLPSLQEKEKEKGKDKIPNDSLLESRARDLLIDLEKALQQTNATIDKMEKAISPRNERPENMEAEMTRMWLLALHENHVIWRKALPLIAKRPLKWLSTLGNEDTVFFRHRFSKYLSFASLFHRKESRHPSRPLAIEPSRVVLQKDKTPGSPFQELQSSSSPLHLPYIPPDYSALQNDEDAINNQLQECFDLVFEEEEVSLEVKNNPLLPFGYTGDDPLLRDRFDRIDNSLEACYWSRPHKIKEVKVKNLKTLSLLYVKLKHLKNRLQGPLEEEKIKIIESFAILCKHTEYQGVITLNDVWRFVESFKGYNRYGEKGPSLEQVQILELCLAKYEHKKSRLHQIENILKEMEEIPSSSHQPLEDLSPEEISSIEEKLEAVADGLLARTAFSFVKTPPKQLRTHLRYQSDKLMWPRQVKIIKKQLKTENRNSVIGEICSSGKTEVILPNEIQVKGDGSNLVLVVAPKAVSGTLFNVISGLLSDLFSKTSYRHHHERAITYGKSTLEALWVTLDSARTEKEPIFLTREDFESLYGIVIDSLHHYVHVSKENNPDEAECLLYLKKIMTLIADHGSIIGDEAHALYLQTEKLHLPIGKEQTIRESYFNAVKACFSQLVRHPKMKSVLEENKLYSLSKDTYREEILGDVANALLSFFHITDNGHQEDFIDFICKKTKAPLWMKNHASYQEMCLAKGVLTILLEQNRKRKNRVGVDFGVSKMGRGEFARPYSGNTHPEEESTIQDPYETLVKTFLRVLVDGLNSAQVGKLIKKLNEKTTLEMKRRNVPFEKTKFFKITDDPEIIDLIQKANTSTQPNVWEQISAKVNQNPELLFLYVRYYIWKEIKYWEWSIEVDTQKSASLVKEQISGSGSPYNEGTFPTHVKLIEEPETLGESLATIHSSCPDEELMVLKQDSPEDNPLRPLDILYKIFDLYLSDPLCSMINDGGAMFTGLEPEFIAREMLRYAKEHRPEIKVVKFFKKDQQNIDQIYELYEADGIPQLEKKHKREECLTFIDQPHGLAANIPQKKPGFAVVTIGPSHPLFSQIQQSYREFRDRKKRRLQPLTSHQRDSAQGVRFVTTEEVQKMISKTTKGDPSKAPTLVDTFAYGAHSEAKIVGRDNWESMPPKINVILHKSIFGKMLRGDFKTFVGLYKEFEEKVFLTKLRVVPSELFDLIPTKVEPKVALEAYAANVCEKFETTQQLTEKEKAEVQASIEALQNPASLPPLPALVTVYHQGDGNYQVGIMDQLNQQLQIQNTTTVHEQNELQLTQRNQIQTQFHSARYVEWDWPENISVNSLKWLKTVSPMKTSLGKKKKNEKRICPCFTIRETLAYSEERVLKSIAEEFDERLWYPNNWLPRWVGPLEKSAEIGSSQQRDLFEILIHVKETKNGTEILKVAPLSQHDAAIWRDKLNEAIDKDPEYWSKQPVKTILWDIHSRVVAAGYQTTDIEKFIKNDHLKQMVVSLKFLNGDVDYTHYRKSLKRWLERVSNPKVMVDAFRIIHAQRNSQPIAGSDMDYAISCRLEHYE